MPRPANGATRPANNWQTVSTPAPPNGQEKQAKADAAANTFEAVARDWLEKTAANAAAITQLKVKTWLEKDAFPFIGKMPISTIGPRDVLDKVVRKLEARGAHRHGAPGEATVRAGVPVCGCLGLAERDVTADLRDALTAKTKTHHAAITEPKLVGDLHALDLRLHRPSVHRGGVEAVPAGVCASRRTADGGMGRD